MDELGGLMSDKMRLSDHATVFQSEIKAITMACDLFMAKERDETKMVIHVDSQAALKALVANKTRSAMVWEAITKLRQIAKEHEVELRWVKAHVGHHMNEEVDELAKEATLGEIRTTGLPMATAKKALRDKLIENWQSEWTNTPEHRQSKLLWPEINLAKSKALTLVSKSTYSQILRWLTGFTGLKHMNFRFGLENDNVCRLCECENEDSPHVLLRCPTLAFLRWHSLGTYLIEDSDELSWNWSAPSLIKFLKNKTVRALEISDDLGLISYKGFDEIQELYDLIQLDDDEDNDEGDDVI